MTDEARKTIGSGFEIIVTGNDPRITPIDGEVGSMIIYKSVGEAPVWFAKLASGISTAVQHIVLLNNYAGAIAPAVTDDHAAGYCVGSEWLDAVAGRWYKCRADTEGAAVWDLLN